jgi:hypothetical protein
MQTIQTAKQNMPAKQRSGKRSSLKAHYRKRNNARQISKHARQNSQSLSSLRFEFHCSAASAEHDGALRHMLGEDLAIVKTALTLGASEAVLMPFSAQGLNVLSNDSCTTLSAFRCSPLSALRLAIDAPRVAILFDMCHTVLKRITALSAEEMSVVPMSAEGDNVLTKNRGLAVLTARSEQLMPVKMAKES